MIGSTQFLERIGIDNQKIEKKYSAGSDWDLQKVLQRFLEMNNMENLLHEFWQRTSDACPLETTEAEQQEIEFKNWVIENQNK